MIRNLFNSSLITFLWMFDPNFEYLFTLQKYSLYSFKLCPRRLFIFDLVKNWDEFTSSRPDITAICTFISWASMISSSPSVFVIVCNRNVFGNHFSTPVNFRSISVRNSLLPWQSCYRQLYKPNKLYSWILAYPLFQNIRIVL